MKKNLLSFFMLACVASVSSLNLVQNGNFEEWNSMSGTPTNWIMNFSAWTNKSSDAQSGNYSAEVEASANGIGHISTAKFDVVAGATYTCSFYYKIPNGKTLTKFEATILNYEEVFPESIATEGIEHPATEWTKKEFTFTSTKNQNINMQILFWTDDDAKVLLDNVVIEDISTSGISNNVNNSDISIYPNPATNYIVVNNENIESVKIYSLTGTLLISSTNNTIDISGLVASSYIVSVVFEGKTINSKLVKK